MTKSEALDALRVLFNERFRDHDAVRDVLAFMDSPWLVPNFTAEVADIWWSLVSQAEQKGQIRELIQSASCADPADTQTFASLLYHYRNGEATETKLVLFSNANSLALSEIEKELLQKMFPNADELRLRKEFSDGATDTRVLLIAPFIAEIEHLHAVVKIGAKPLIEQEWQAVQQNSLKTQLPNVVSIQGEPIYVSDTDGIYWGGLRYEQVGGGIVEVESLGRYASDASYEDVWHLLQNRLLQQLDKLWQTTREEGLVNLRGSYDNLLPVNFVASVHVPDAESTSEPIIDLDASTMFADGLSVPRLQRGLNLRLLNFEVTELAPSSHEVTLNLPRQQREAHLSYRIRIQCPELIQLVQVGQLLPPTICKVQQARTGMLLALAQKCVGPELNLAQANLILPDTDDYELPNPLRSLPSLLQRSHQASFAIIHGDLHLRNVLVAAEDRTAHIIDCASARRDHVLHDLLRLERDILTELLAEIHFKDQLAFTDIYMLLLSVHCAQQREARESGQFAVPKELSPTLHKLYIMLITVRRAAEPFLNPNELWQEYYAGLMIHLLGSLKFKALDVAPVGREPKTIAFWSAAIVGAFFKGEDNCESLAGGWTPLPLVQQQ